MALPVLLAYAAYAVIGGVGATAATKTVRTVINQGETISVRCPHCGNMGPHQFARLDKGYIAGGVAGLALGAIGGTIGGVVAKRVFDCAACGEELYENGQPPTWNADRAAAAATTSFFNYDDQKKAWRDLEELAKYNKERAEELELAVMTAWLEVERLQRQIECLDNARMEAIADRARLEDERRQHLDTIELLCERIHMERSQTVG